MKSEVESTTSNNNTIDSNPYQSTEASSVNNSVVVKEEEIRPLPIVDLGLPFTIGDLVWAYISGYPLWPSLITPDPLDNLYTKTRGMSSRFEAVLRLYLLI